MIRRPPPDPAPGFTLIELAIVLFVLTLLLGGMLTPLGQQIAERQNSETRKILDQARTALVGYALGHRGANDAGHLPCPDQRTGAPRDHGGDGLEDRLPDGRCAVAWGLLPWRTLGLVEGDAWGNRLDYAVADDWSRGTASGPASPRAGLEICPDLACTQPVASAAILVSHGRNGFGAFNGTQGINAPPSSPEELENLDGDGRFILHPPRAPDRPGGEFDDLLVVISGDWLRGRLCDPAAVCAQAPR